MMFMDPSGNVLRTGSGIEAALMDEDANPPARRKQPPLSPGLFGILFAIVFFLLVLLLGLSMVHHRFFRGERVHQNGSVGQ